ncbi:MAG: Spy/CpxP family protein refolding chaperone [Rhizobacter sp.]
MTPSVNHPSPLSDISAITHGAPKTSVRYWLIGALAALASSVALSAWAQPGGQGMHGGMMGGNPQHMQRLLSGINATDDQKARIQQIMQKTMNDMAGQREAGRTFRDKARAIFAAPTVDANAAEQLRQQMLALQDQNSRRMMAAMLEVSQVLTPEQRVQMADHMQKHAKQRGEDRGGKPAAPGEPKQP